MHAYNDYDIIYVLWEIFIVIFSLQKLQAQAGNDPKKFLFFLYKWYKTKNTVKMRKDSYVMKYPLTGGSSFLVNPDPLFTLAKTVDILHIVQYVVLAAHRDLLLYKQFNITTLPLSYFPDLDLENLKSNPLLEVTNSEIKFKYE